MGKFFSKVGAIAGGVLGGPAGFLMGGTVGSALNADNHKGLNKFVDGSKTFWDTHIGREGLIGGIGDMTGLWESGTTADRKKRATNAVTNLANEAEERHIQKKSLLDMQLNNNLYTMNSKVGSNVGGLINSGNLATDNSRGVNINRVIADNIKAKNSQLFETQLQKLTADDNHATQMAVFDQQKKSIENS